MRYRIQVDPKDSKATILIFDTPFKHSFKDAAAALHWLRNYSSATRDELDEIRRDLCAQVRAVHLRIQEVTDELRGRFDREYLQDVGNSGPVTDAYARGYWQNEFTEC